MVCGTQTMGATDHGFESTTMKSSESLLKAIVDISPVQFGVYDLVKHSLEFSSGLAERILGVDFQELQRLSQDFYRSIIYKEDYPHIERNLELLMNSQQDQTVESIFRVRAKGGKTVWVRAHHQVLERDQQGKPTKIITSSEDISELKALEQSLAEAVKNLQAVDAEDLEELQVQLNAVTMIVKMFKENHFSSKMDQRLWDFMRDSVLKMNEVLEEMVERG